jgi:hypothetical protein
MQAHEIRGWAANQLSETVDSQTKKEGHRFNLEPSPSSMPAKDSPKFQEQNFTTEQGVTGKLRVEIGSDTSLMTLTLSQGNVLYNWQGQCNSEQFAITIAFSITLPVSTVCHPLRTSDSLPATPISFSFSKGRIS